MGKHYGKVIIEKVLRMKAQGMTHRAIGEEYGLTMIQIKKLVERDRKSKRMLRSLPGQKGDRGRDRSRWKRIIIRKSSVLRWK